MATFRNKNYRKRDYECTNIVYCQADSRPADHWQECEASEITTQKCESLYVQQVGEMQVRYFGYL